MDTGVQGVRRKGQLFWEDFFSQFSLLSRTDRLPLVVRRLDVCEASAVVCFPWWLRKDPVRRILIIDALAILVLVTK